MNQKVKNALHECGRAAKSIDQLAAEISREHKIMFGGLAQIRAELDKVPVLGEGGDYLSQLLDFRRKTDEILKQTWEMLGL